MSAERLLVDLLTLMHLPRFNRTFVKLLRFRASARLKLPNKTPGRYRHMVYMFDLTGFQRDLLYVIAGLEQPSGQRIRRKIEEFVGEVTHGRLYPNLDTLVQQQLIEKGQQNRRTNYYELTPKGQRLLTDRRNWENRQVDFLNAEG